MNEQVLRFLNLRYPRDYDTVPRAYFWLFHLLWLFPWSVYFPAVAQLRFQAGGPRRADAPAGALLDRLPAGLLHLLHHAGVLFDAVLSGAGPAAGLGHGGGRRLDATRHAGAGGGRGLRGRGVRSRFWSGWCAAFPRRAISRRRSRSIPGAYTLSLGHMEDLTLASFAYLRLPLAVAAPGVSAGSVLAPLSRGRTATAAASGGRADDGAVLPRGAAGDGGVRSLSLVAAAGGSACCARPRAS